MWGWIAVAIMLAVFFFGGCLIDHGMDFTKDDETP